MKFQTKSEIPFSSGLQSRQHQIALLRNFCTFLKITILESASRNNDLFCSWRREKSEFLNKFSKFQKDGLKMPVAIEDILKVYKQQTLDNLFLQKNPNSQSNACRLWGGSGGVALLGSSCAIPKLLDVVKHIPFVSSNNIGSAVSPSQTLWKKKSQYINVGKDATVLRESAVKGIGTTALPKQKEHWSA